jgi:hypothetical protein
MFQASKLLLESIFTFQKVPNIFGIFIQLLIFSFLSKEMNESKNSEGRKVFVYTIRSYDETITDFYVGRCTNYSTRHEYHKQNSMNEEKTEKLYRFIREHGGWFSFRMQVIEERMCATNKEAQDFENEVFDRLKPTLNSIRPKKDKAEEKKFDVEYSRAYRMEKKEEINARRKEIITCDICNVSFQRRNKAQHEKSEDHKSNMDSLKK